jgi:hypothetical protein
MSLRGWIYVLENPSLEGLVKIGFSTKDPIIRVRELSSTGVPRSYSIVYEALVENPRELEQRVHSNLHAYHETKEFFRTTPDVAVAAIRAVAKEVGVVLRLERRNDRDLTTETPPLPENLPAAVSIARSLSPSTVYARSQLDSNRLRKTRLAKTTAMQGPLTCPHCGSEKPPSPSGYCQSCFGLYRGHA